MAMLRSFTVRRSHNKYERLVDEQPEVCFLGSKLPRSTSVPAQQATKLAPALPSDNLPVKSAKRSKSHPLFGLFDGRRRKRATAKPEFARYLEYVKEGGMWDLKANVPVIHYK